MDGSYEKNIHKDNFAYSFKNLGKLCAEVGIDLEDLNRQITNVYKIAQKDRLDSLKNPRKVVRVQQE